MEEVKLPTTSIEAQKTYKIEHFPDFDVVVNLDYPDQESINIIGILLKDNPLGDGILTEEELVKKLSSLNDEDNISRFFVKNKYKSAQMVDFIRGRTNEDFINSILVFNLSNRIRYAFAGVQNELVLSKRIKELVALSSVQESARRNGFTKVDFVEPMAAIVFKTSHEKYLIYKNIIGHNSLNFSDEVRRRAGEVTKDLEGIFLNNGITPNDLRLGQFMISVDENGEFFLTLTDIEAYTLKD